MADAKQDFTKMDAAKLQTTIMDLRKEQLDSRFAKAMGQFEGEALNAARASRKNIARAKTQLSALKNAEKAELAAEAAKETAKEGEAS